MGVGVGCWGDSLVKWTVRIRWRLKDVTYVASCGQLVRGRDMIVTDKIHHATLLLRPMDLALLCVPVQFETSLLCTRARESKSYGK